MASIIVISFSLIFIDFFYFKFCPLLLDSDVRDGYVYIVASFFRISRLSLRFEFAAFILCLANMFVFSFEGLALFFEGFLKLLIS